MHEMRIKITALTGIANRHTSVISFDALLCFLAQEGFSETRFCIKMEIFCKVARLLAVCLQSAWMYFV